MSYTFKKHFRATLFTLLFAGVSGGTAAAAGSPDYAAGNDRTEKASPKSNFPDKPLMILAEQAQGQVVIVDPANGETLWQWSAATSNLPAEEHVWFTNIDEVKPVYNRQYILLTASGGAVALIRIADRKVMFYACPGGNPHSAELLPDGNLAVASSQGNALTLYRVDTTACFGTPAAVYPLQDGHNVVWDRRNDRLIAASMNTIRFYRYTGGKNPRLTECTADSIHLPDAEYIHDLYPAHGQQGLWMTDGKGIYLFDPGTRSAKQTAFSAPNAKSVASSPEGYPVIVLLPTESWWSDSVIGTDGQPVYRRKGARIYKARWLLDNRFSYPARHPFTQPD